MNWIPTLGLLSSDTVACGASLPSPISPQTPPAAPLFTVLATVDGAAHPLFVLHHGSEQ
jgi:hypothetical protein